MSRVRLEHRDGTLVAVKVATDPAEVSRLHREARVLAVARLPGVVELIGLDDRGDEADLVTRAVVGGSLATSRPDQADRALALVAAVAAIVADLHELGIVHAAIDPSHVLLDERGRPVLCGFGSAGLVGDPLPQRRTDGPGPPPTLRPSRDVYALGRLLEHLTAPAEPTSSRHRSSRTPTLHRSIAALVAQATAEDPTCRPTAAAFLEGVLALTPSPLLALDPEPPARGIRPHHRPEEHAGREATPPHRRRGRLLAAAVSASAVIGIVVLEVGRPDPPEVATVLPVGAAPPSASVAPPPGESTTAGLDAPGPTGLSSSTEPTRPTTPTSTPPTTGPRAPSCDDARQPVAPTAPAPPCTRSAPAPAEGIIVGADRYAVGDPGDEVLVGDWRCDTSLDVTVVRPRTGDVYLFERLPHSGDPDEVGAVQIAHLGPGAHLEAGPADPDGCPALVGRLADGTTTGIAVPDQLPPDPDDPEHP